MARPATALLDLIKHIAAAPPCGLYEHWTIDEIFDKQSKDHYSEHMLDRGRIAP
jgi:hypothetical protein